MCTLVTLVGLVNLYFFLSLSLPQQATRVGMTELAEIKKISKAECEQACADSADGCQLFYPKKSQVKNKKKCSLFKIAVSNWNVCECDS